MGTSSTVAQFVGKLNKATNILVQQNGPSSKPLLAAVKEAKKIQKIYMVKAIGPDMRMGKMRIGIRDEKISRGYLVKATGPAHLIERNTSAHWIGPKSKRGGRGRKGNARRLTAGAVVGALTGGGMAIGFGQGIRMPGAPRGWRAYAYHPGTTGKHPFEQGMKAAVRPAAIAYRKAAMTELLKAFG